MNIRQKIGDFTAKAIKAIENLPTAEVVPKSEVEELSGRYEDLKLMYSDLEKDKDELFAWVNDKKTEVAREIFEALDKLMKEHKEMFFCDWYLYEKYTELRKKYVEDE